MMAAGAGIRNRSVKNDSGGPIGPPLINVAWT